MTRKEKKGGSGVNDIQTTFGPNAHPHPLTKAGVFSGNIYGKFSELERNYKGDEIKETFSWTPNEQPDNQKKDIKFYFYIPAQWPDFYVTEFAAFQVLFYLTILQQFLNEVSTNQSEDWLNDPKYDQKPGVWEKAFEKAQKYINSHHEKIKSAKTESTSVEFSSQMNSGVKATSTQNQIVAPPGTPVMTRKQVLTNLNQMNSKSETPIVQPPALLQNKNYNQSVVKTPQSAIQSVVKTPQSGQTPHAIQSVVKTPQSGQTPHAIQSVVKTPQSGAAKPTQSAIQSVKTPQSVTSDDLPQIAAAAVATHITQNSKP